MVQFKKCTSSSVDKGWAWVILIGSTVEYFITVGMFKTFGIFFVEYQRKFSASSSAISLVLSIQTVVGSISSIILMGIGMHYIGKRALIISAAFFGLGSNLGNAFALNPSFLFLSQSTLYALSVACAHLPCTIVLGEYFEKRRGLANAVANLGASIGGLTWPPLIVYLLGEYGLQGTLIIIGGVYLHFIPIGLVMSDILLKKRGPIAQHNKKQEDVDSEIPKELTTENQDIIQNNVLKRGQNSATRKEMVDNHIDEHPENFLILTSENITTSVQSQMESATSLEMHYNTICKTEHKKNFILKILTTVFDFSLLKDGCFLLLMASSFLIAAASAIPITYIPPFASDRGLQTSKLGYIVTMSGASDIVGNIIFIFISDTQKVQRHHMLAIAMTSNGILCLLASLFTNFVSLAIFGVLHTILGGAYFCLINVLVVDFIGVEKLNYGIVTATVTKDVSIAITSIVVGLIRDSTGSYVGGFYLMGVCSVVGGMLLLLKPFIHVPK